MPTTYTPLATTTAAGGESTITLSNISAAYTDLVLVINGRTTANGTYLNLRFNNDTTNTLSATRLLGNGSTATSSRSTASNLLTLTPNTAWDNTNPGVIVVNIMNYSNTATNKTVLIRGNIDRPGVGGEVTAIVGMWASTSAINRIDIITGSSSFLAGTTFSLYGVASAAVVSGAKATGGDVVATDGTYWYHAFRTSGTFTPTSTLSCDVLAVAGGGGGIDLPGGGAGGVIYQAGRSVSTATTVTVGAGGTGGRSSGPTVYPTSGVDSYFGALKAFGGGAGGSGGSSPQYAGVPGGSGGGAENGNYAGGASTQTSNNGGTGYGNAGGTNTTGVNYKGSGGGGAGGAGKANNDPSGGSFSTGGAGGVGLNTWSSWATATGTGADGGYFAGGGGTGAVDNLSGAGGLGGGGKGGQSGTSMGPNPKLFATSGTANTGGGGGGGGWGGDGYSLGGNGGSGIVIVRYSV